DIRGIGTESLRKTTERHRGHAFRGVRLFAPGDCEDRMLRGNQFGHSILVGRPVSVNGLPPLSPKILFREKSLSDKIRTGRGESKEGESASPVLLLPEPLSPAAQRAFPHCLRPVSAGPVSYLRVTHGRHQRMSHAHRGCVPWEPATHP